MMNLPHFNLTADYQMQLKCCQLVLIAMSQQGAGWQTCLMNLIPFLFCDYFLKWARKISIFLTPEKTRILKNVVPISFHFWIQLNKLLHNAAYFSAVTYIKFEH